MKYDYVIVGLGNPGEEYKETRHNAGRMVLEALVKKVPEGMKTGEWAFEKKRNALLAEGKLGKKTFLLLLPETFMNKSGESLKGLIGSAKAAHNLILVRDDIDLPLGKLKIVYNRGTGGHKGLESIVRAVKTSEFAQIKIGVSPATPKGKIKKPDQEKVVDFIVGKFKPAETEILKKTIKEAKEAVFTLLKEGREKAMNEYN